MGFRCDLGNWQRAPVYESCLQSECLLKCLFILLGASMCLSLLWMQLEQDTGCLWLFIQIGRGLYMPNGSPYLVVAEQSDRTVNARGDGVYFSESTPSSNLV
ncbi:hypothetical protein P885DRAFT_61885 [Corynascus similis CBS 632.67]